MEAFAVKLQESLLQLHERYGAVKRSHELKIERRRHLERLLSESLKPHRIYFMNKDLSGEKPLVYHLKRSRFRYSGSGQVVGVKAFKDVKDIQRELFPFRKHLQCLSVGGMKRDHRLLQKCFQDSSRKRIGEIGRSQNPSLS